MIEQVIWARAIVPFFVYDWSYILIQVSQVSPHALNQRSPARSGIENRWPKGKAKVKGVLLESFRLFSPYYRSFWIFLACQPYRSKNFSHFFSAIKINEYLCSDITSELPNTLN